VVIKPTTASSATCICPGCRRCIRHGRRSATYTAIPANPSWLQFSDVDSFKPGGSTLAALDDAHVVAASPDATGPTVMRQVASDLGALPEVPPNQVQALGDMADTARSTI